MNTLAFVNFLLVKIFPTLIRQYFPPSKFCTIRYTIECNSRQMLAASWGEPEQYHHAIVSVLLTVGSNGTEPGFILLPAENNLGICLSLSQSLQLPLSVINMFGNHSRPMQNLSNSMLSWKPLILAISSGLLYRGNLWGCGSWRWLDKSSTMITCLWW